MLGEKKKQSGNDISKMERCDLKLLLMTIYNNLVSSADIVLKNTDKIKYVMFVTYEGNKKKRKGIFF